MTSWRTRVNPVRQNAVTASVPVQLTPLESLCFAQVEFWVGVVEKSQGRCGRLVDGRPYTRLPAAELVATLEERYPFLSVTVRQVRRALNRLVELGLLVRDQLWRQERWRSDYWYSRGDLPVTPQSPEEVLRSDPEVTSYLSTPSSSLPEQNQETERVTSSLEPTTEQPAALSLDPERSPGPSQTSPKPSRGGRHVGCRPGALESLRRVVEKACARGSGRKTQTNSHTPRETWAEGEFIFTRLESGLVLKDHLKTAPLR